MLKLWKDIERGIIAIVLHKGFRWYSRVDHGYVFEYSDNDELFVIQYTNSLDGNNLLITRIINKQPIEYLFDGITGEYDLMATIENTINGALKEKFREIFQEISFLSEERN